MRRRRHAPPPKSTFGRYVMHAPPHPHWCCGVASAVQAGTKGSEFFVLMEGAIQAQTIRREVRACTQQALVAFVGVALRKRCVQPGAQLCAAPRHAAQKPRALTSSAQDAGVFHPVAILGMRAAFGVCERHEVTLFACVSSELYVVGVTDLIAIFEDRPRVLQNIENVRPPNRPSPSLRASCTLPPSPPWVDARFPPSICAGSIS